MWGRLGKCGGRWGKWVEDPISPTSPLTSLTLQHTSPHLPPQLFSHLPPYFSTPTPTLPHSFHIPPILDPTPQTTKNSPITPPSILPQILYNPYSSPYSFPPYYHCYFIIYPTPKLLTFLIYCQINPAIN